MVNQQQNTPTSKDSKIGLIFSIVVIGAIGLFYTLSYLQGQKNIENGDIGDCTAYTAGKDKPYKIEDCGSDKAKYKILGFADTANKQSCLDIAGTTRTISSVKGTVCMTDKNANPQMGINTVKQGDCVNSTGSNAQKIACTDTSARYVVLKKLDNVSKVAPGNNCRDEPDSTMYFGWGIEQTGGQYRIKSVTYDRFFCLGRNAS